MLSTSGSIVYKATLQCEEATGTQKKTRGTQEKSSEKGFVACLWQNESLLVLSICWFPLQSSLTIRRFCHLPVGLVKF